MKKDLVDKLQTLGNKTTNVLTNVALGALSLKGIEYLDNLDYSTTTQALATLAAGAGIYALNKYDSIKTFSKGINEAVREIPGKAMPYIRNGVILPLAIAGTIALSKDPAINLYNDFSNKKEDKEFVIDSSVKRMAPKSLETHVGNYQTIQQTKNIPAIVVESFFGSNENDLAYFQVKKNREDFCDKVVSGIENYVLTNSKVKTITIAGGHGENYPGACFGPNKDIEESTFTKEMSKYIANKLEEKGHKVNHLWYTGPFDSKKGQSKRLNEYTNNANKHSGESVYVEIHADASRPEVAGSRVFGPKPKNKNPESHRFGKIVLNEINKSW